MMELLSDKGHPSGPALAKSTALEQFILLSKSARGAAAAKLVQEAIENPSVFVFAELLEQPNIITLNENEATRKYYQALEIFAYGTYKDYVARAAELPPLNEATTKKLRYLTIITLCSHAKQVPYSLLLSELDLASLRSLEDLIIDAIYLDLLQARMDQNNACLEVEAVHGRDVRKEELGSIVSFLTGWMRLSESTLASLSQQADAANLAKEEFQNMKTETAEKIAALRASVRAGDIDMRDSISDSTDYRNDRPAMAERTRRQTRPRPGTDGPTPGRKTSRFIK